MEGIFPVLHSEASYKECRVQVKKPGGPNQAGLVSPSSSLLGAFELQINIFGLLSLVCFLLYSCTIRCKVRGKLLEKVGSGLSLSLFIMKVQSSGYLDLSFVCVWLSKTSVLKGCKLFGTSLEANKLFLCLNNSGYFLPGAM